MVGQERGDLGVAGDEVDRGIFHLTVELAQGTGELFALLQALDVLATGQTQTGEGFRGRLLLGVSDIVFQDLIDLLGRRALGGAALGLGTGNRTPRFHRFGHELVGQFGYADVADVVFHLSDPRLFTKLAKFLAKRLLPLGLIDEGVVAAG